MSSCAGEAWHELALRRRIRTSLAAWAKFALAARGQRPAAHHLVLLSALESLERGDIYRLMVLMPPGSAKSTYASQLFPAWWLARHPDGALITASHTAALASHFGYKVRGLVDEHGGRLGVAMAHDARAADRFRTTAGGEYYAVGVLGAVTGRRADLIVIDDPIRSARHAASDTSRAALWEWFRADLTTRLKPQGKMALIMTRWHTEDLAAKLLEQGDWNSLRLPAIAEDGDFLGRPTGTPLWPEWEDEAALETKRTQLGEQTFAALFQQAPMRGGGRVFDVAKIGALDAAPAGMAVRAWDLAGTASTTADWTVGLRLVRDAECRYIVQDVRRERVEAADITALIRSVAQHDGRQVVIGLPRDPGQAGKFQIASLTKELAGFRLASTPETGPKVWRAVAIATQVNGGNLAITYGTWNTAFLDELACFPNGRHDDQVDALSRAFELLTEITEPARFADFPILAR